MMQMTQNSPGAAAFPEDLVDACVMEYYSREHMAERDLLFLDALAPALEGYNLLAVIKAEGSV